MDGHWSALPFWNMAWFTISVANYATRGGSKIPNKSIINNPKLRLCPFIARPPMDGHISGTMRKPFQFSFQNNRQNWNIIGSQNVMVNAMGALSPEVDPKSRKNQLSIIPNYAFAHYSQDRRWMGTGAVFCFRFCCLCIHIIMCFRSKHHMPQT